MRENFYNIGLKTRSKFSSKREVVELCYEALIDSYQRVRLIAGISSLNENGIRDQFVIDLEESNAIIRKPLQNCIIKIIPESYNAKTRKRPDIEFFLPVNKRSLFIECKKLTSAERRYVDDGLSRFVQLIYAKDDDDAGMLGFVINTNYAATIAKLKEMVSEFHIISFDDSPILGYRYSFLSVHKRTNDTSISISHLFFKLDL
jgi:hypothetical protein